MNGFAFIFQQIPHKRHGCTSHSFSRKIQISFFFSSKVPFLLSPEQAGRIQVEMPSLGNSHPWMKNHTAITSNTISNSFIIVLSMFPFSVTRQGYGVISFSKGQK